MPFQKVLIAVDASPLAAHAAEVGAALAKALSAQVGLVTVVDRSVASVIAAEASPAELLESARLEASRLVTALRLRLALEPTTLEFKPEGDPADEIVAAAKGWPADMIVIGSHGRGGVDRMLLGSVAEKVMRHASCPVLVVRTQG